MGVQYTHTIIHLGRTHTKFRLGHYQALEFDGLFRRRPKVQMRIDSFAHPKLRSKFYVMYEMD